MTRLAPVIAVMALLGACAEPPPVDGARCPCGPGYICDPTFRCVRAVLPPPSPDAGTPPAMVPSRCVDPGPAPLRRLTAEEYRATVVDLLGVNVAHGALPQEWPGANGFRNDAERQQVTDDEWAQRYPVLARDLSTQAIGALERLVACDTRARGEDACGADFVARFGRRAYRRPLEPAEREALLAQLRAGTAARGFAEGIRRVVETALSARAFTHRLERGVPAAAGATVVALTPWEIATRLSYLLWGTMPDDQLFQAAEEGRLSSREEVRAQALRMLEDRRLERMLLGFHREWLRLEEGDLPAKRSPPFTSALRAAVQRSADAFVSGIVWSRDADLASLFGFPSVFADAEMARFYELATPAAPFDPVAPRSGQPRFGVLTLPTSLAAFGHDGESAPVLRGLFVVEQLLCTELPAPPADIPPPLPAQASSASLTTRERYAVHVQNPACSVCHRLFDPIGFGLENYDGYGRWRTTERGLRIDSTGSIRGTPFDGPGALAEYLGASRDVSACVVRQWFRHAFARRELDVDACTLTALEAGFDRAGRRPRALLLELVQSDAFLTKRP